MAEVERALILLALEQSDWINAHAAKLLSLQRTTLVEKMRKYRISQETDSS
jgi:sigma-54 specific flagellar transcriptional regulator A